MKTLVIITIAVIGLLSLSLVNNAFANESAFRAAAEKAWKEILAQNATQIISIPNGTNSTTNANTGDVFCNLGSSPTNVKIIN